jgi:hypothetical protein
MLIDLAGGRRLSDALLDVKTDDMMTRYSTINVLRDQQYRWKRRCCVAQMRPMQDQIFLSFQER